LVIYLVEPSLAFLIISPILLQYLCLSVHPSKNTPISSQIRENELKNDGVMSRR